MRKKTVNVNSAVRFIKRLINDDQELQLEMYKREFIDCFQSVINFRKEQQQLLLDKFRINNIMIHKFVGSVCFHEDREFVHYEQTLNHFVMFPIELYTNNKVGSSDEVFCDFVCVDYEGKVVKYDLIHKTVSDFDGNVCSSNVDYIVFDGSKLHGLSSNCAMIVCSFAFDVSAIIEV